MKKECLAEHVYALLQERKISDIYTQMSKLDTDELTRFYTKNALLFTWTFSFLASDPERLQDLLQKRLGKKKGEEIYRMYDSFLNEIKYHQPMSYILLPYFEVKDTQEKIPPVAIVHQVPAGSVTIKNIEGLDSLINIYSLPEDYLATSIKLLLHPGLNVATQEKNPLFMTYLFNVKSFPKVKKLIESQKKSEIKIPLHERLT